MKPFPEHKLGVTLQTRDIFELTRREWDVLLQVANDLTNAEIAEQLCLTPKSVENYRARIGCKLNMKGTRLLARFARQHGPELQQWFQLVTGESAQLSVTHS
ncbi:response regulator transcription factor [Spirosoma soli]|uniref:Response regulator transcription factor n=1 Tax=Spirosoma soli TaxID=1770529 RepID=A0ABW5MA07_9BACT